MDQARDEAVSDGIGRVGHDDWNRAGCPLQRRQGGGYASNNDIKFQSHKLSHTLGKSLVLPLRGAPLDDEILSFDITQLAHPLLECSIRAERRLARYCGEEANAPDLAGLLRPRGEWPRRRGPAEQCDELAARHSITSSAVKIGRAH